MPERGRYKLPDSTPQELIERIEAFEKLTVFGGVKEPLTKREPEKTLFTPSKINTTLVTVLLQSASEKSSAIELYDGKGNHIENLIASKPHGEFQICCTFILAANESWEWRKVVGSEGENIYSTYWSIGGIGTQGPQGEKGEKGEKGTTGEKGAGFSIAELEAQRWKNWIPEKIEKLKKLVGEGLEITKVKKIVGELLEIEKIKLLKGEGATLEGFKFVTVSEILESQGLIAGRAAAFTSALEGEVETVNLSSLAFQYNIELTGALNLIVERLETNGKRFAGTIIVLTNAAGKNLIMVNEGKKTETTGKFKFSTKANITLEPGHSIFLICDVNNEWRDIGFR